jgi:hypothetical protein
MAAGAHYPIWQPRFTESHADNFDIYLPNWLAQYNGVILGVLFIAGELVGLGY